MDLREFQERVRAILDVDLPSLEPILQDALAIARETTLGRTLFFDKMGVNSEAEFKRRAVRDDRIMYHAHIGLGSWKATAEALRSLYRSGKSAGIEIDRAGICLDRRMGLPPELRSRVPAETGPTLDRWEDWQQVGQVVPIQPHMGDFMIGFPASTENTIQALRAGVTTIGNLSQFFAHRAPLQEDVPTTIETVRAIAVLAFFRSKDVLLHSYLEDGYGALFCDCATIAGWALLERYIVEDLLKAKLTHCIGGLTTDPVKRVGWVFALDAIHEREGVGSMIYGDTISFGSDLTVNRAHLGEYLLWDVLAQLKCPTGHAILPLPVTEAFRIPSPEEILEAQVFGNRVEQTARRLFPHVDFSPAEEFAHKTVAAGKHVFHNALDGLKDAGVNTRDPLQLLYVLRKLGPAVFEEMFGAGRPDPAQFHGRRPVWLTDIFAASEECLKTYRPLFEDLKKDPAWKGQKLLIASSDVHEHAILILRRLLDEIGIKTVYLGAERSPGQVAKAALEHSVTGILISTHNGMARDYALRLKEDLSLHQIKVPVILGGVLNQKVDDQELPVPVAKELKRLGFYPADRLEGHLPRLLTTRL